MKKKEQIFTRMLVALLIGVSIVSILLIIGCTKEADNPLDPQSNTSPTLVVYQPSDTTVWFGCKVNFSGIIENAIENDLTITVDFTTNNQVYQNYVLLSDYTPEPGVPFEQELIIPASTQDSVVFQIIADDPFENSTVISREGWLDLVNPNMPVIDNTPVQNGILTIAADPINLIFEVSDDSLTGESTYVSGIRTVEVTVDDSVYNAEVSATPNQYKFVLLAEHLSGSSGVLHYRAVDNAGNHSPASQPVGLVADTLNPVVVITSPLEGTIINQQAITISGQIIYDNPDLDLLVTSIVISYLDTGTVSIDTTLTINDTLADTFSVLYALSAPYDGDYTVKAWTTAYYDTLETTSDTTRTINFSVNQSIAGFLEIVYPADEVFLNRPDSIVVLYILENSLSYLEFTVKDSAGADVLGDFEGVGNVRTFYPRTDSSYSDTVFINAAITDNAGNSIQRDRQFYYDNILPEINNITSPDTGQSYNYLPSFIFDLTEKNRYYFFLSKNGGASWDDSTNIEDQITSPITIPISDLDEGEYDFSFKVSDKAGNYSEVKNRTGVIFDETAPVLQSVSINGNALIDSIGYSDRLSGVEVKAFYSDGDGSGINVPAITLVDSADESWNPEKNEDSLTYVNSPQTPFTEGDRKTFNLHLEDYAGNDLNSTWYLICDTTRPVIDSVNIYNNMWIDTTRFQVTAQVVDSIYLQSVEFSPDGNNWENMNSLAGQFTYNWTISEDGSYNPAIRAVDGAGNADTLIVGTVNVDANAPSIDSVNLFDDMWINSSPFTVEADVYDLNLDSVLFSPDGSAWHDMDSLAGQFTYNWTISEDGSYNPAIRAVDGAGNADTLIVGTVNVDANAPSIDSVNLFDGMWITSSPFTVQANVIDENLDSVLFSPDGSNWHDMIEGSPGQYEYDWSITLDGQYNPVIRAVDAAGNDSTRAIGVVNVDVNAPELTITSPQEMDIYNVDSSSVIIAGTVADYSLSTSFVDINLEITDGISTVYQDSLINHSSTDWEFSWEISGDPSIYQFIVSAEDTFLHDSESSVNVLIDQEYPEVFFTYPDSGGILHIDCLITGTFSDEPQEFIDSINIKIRYMVAENLTFINVDSISTTDMTWYFNWFDNPDWKDYMEANAIESIEIQSRVIDYAGNSPSLTRIENIIIDLVPPVFGAISPPDTTHFVTGGLDTVTIYFSDELSGIDTTHADFSKNNVSIPTSFYTVYSDSIVYDMYVDFATAEFELTIYDNAGNSADTSWTYYGDPPTITPSVSREDR